MCGVSLGFIFQGRLSLPIVLVQSRPKHSSSNPLHSFVSNSVPLQAVAISTSGVHLVHSASGSLRPGREVVARAAGALAPSCSIPTWGHGAPTPFRQFRARHRCCRADPIGSSQLPFPTQPQTSEGCVACHAAASSGVLSHKTRQGKQDSSSAGDRAHL